MSTFYDYLNNIKRDIMFNFINREESMKIFIEKSYDSMFYTNINCSICLESIVSSSPISMTFMFCTKCKIPLCMLCFYDMVEQHGAFEFNCHICRKVRLFSRLIPDIELEINYNPNYLFNASEECIRNKIESDKKKQQNINRKLGKIHFKKL